MTLDNGVRHGPDQSLDSQDIRRATGKTAMPPNIQRVLPGLHHGKTAVITGETRHRLVGRYLAMAGASAAHRRSRSKLEEAREDIVTELAAPVGPSLVAC